jgi:hypothetical protein
MTKELKTKHSVMALPSFYPTVGWPGGRGEYDFLFKNLEYFCKKIGHYNFLLNFSSFIFGFTIPANDFNSQYIHFKNKDLRNILIENTSISPAIAQSLIILLDIGGNRIFNKIIRDNLPPTSVGSYKKYLDAYKDFIKNGNPDIFVNFDIGPSYTTRDAISKKGIKIWNLLTIAQKHRINHELLNISINFKKKDNLIMVPVNAAHPDILKKSLDYLFYNYAEEVEIVGLAGIANCPLETIKKALQIFSSYKKDKEWDVLSHGLGLGGWQNIPLLIKYEIDSCDVGSPWRRACTDAISHPYLPLLDCDLNFTDISESFSHSELYNKIYSIIKCTCPFCNDVPLSEVRKRCKEADKHYTNRKLHDKNFREMRIRVFFHNVFQHIALLKKLSDYKDRFSDEFMDKFLQDMPEGKTKDIFSKMRI